MFTMLLDADCADVISLGQLLYKCTTLKNQVGMLHASIHAQGGVVFGTHQFSLEEALTSLVMKTYPKGTDWPRSLVPRLYSIMTRN